jgi:putative two-component system response regulator
MRVLIADDDPTIRLLLQKKLKDWGYDVLTAPNGFEALQILQDSSGPSLALIDWYMPEMDGVDVCLEFKQNRIKKRLVYFIMMTSKNSEEDMIRAIDSGAHSFLSKPISFPILKRYLEVGVRLINAEDEMMAYEKSVRIRCYEALADLAETKDEETGFHMKRINEYAALLAKKAKQSGLFTVNDEFGIEQELITGQFVEEIHTFAALHDIGKVGIDDAILKKPGKLTPEEFEKIKQHSVLGGKILQDVPTMEMAANIAMYHHEKYNGFGYPQGLKATAIPLESRIVALADVYDALRSRRPYKDGWTHEAAFKLITTESGQHFDPILTNLFQSIHLDFADLFHKHADDEY